MEVGLLDVDSKMPNLALMKISQHHKDKGHNVEFYNPMFKYDRLYISKIFTYTDDYKYLLQADEVYKGGSGYNLSKQLPNKIENKTPDYELYPDMDYAMGFTTRGCIRNCNFCLVPEKEGKIKAINDIYDFWTGQDKIMLLDNNLTAHKEHFKKILKQLRKEKVKVDFSQGLDIRLITPEQAQLLSQVKIYKQIHFAFDDIKFEKAVRKGIKTLKDNGIKPYKLMFYILIGFNSTPEEDLYRVELLRDLGVDPFAMPYKDINDVNMQKVINRCGFDNKGNYEDYKKDFARWVNHKAIFKSVDWQDYKKTG